MDRTAETDRKPRSFSAFRTLSPSGSATPFFRWISTRARTLSPPRIGARYLRIIRPVPPRTRESRPSGRSPRPREGGVWRSPGGSTRRRRRCLHEAARRNPSSLSRDPSGRRLRGTFGGSGARTLRVQGVYRGPSSHGPWLGRRRSTPSPLPPAPSRGYSRSTPLRARCVRPGGTRVRCRAVPALEAFIRGGRIGALRLQVRLLARAEREVRHGHEAVAEPVHSDADLAEAGHDQTEVAVVDGAEPPRHVEQPALHVEPPGA